MKQRAFVRYTKQGKIVPGSLIISTTYPERSGNIWREVSMDLCCDATPLTDCIEFVVDTTDGTEFRFAFNSITGPINFTINWGDGTTHPDSGGGGYYEEIHTYPEIGQQYTARICFDTPESVYQLYFFGNS